MARKYIDCREFPSDTKCTVTIAADSERELLDAAAQHAEKVHGHPRHAAVPRAAAGRHARRAAAGLNSTWRALRLAQPG